MANIQIIQGDFNKKLELPIAEGLKAGFPSPAEDYSHETLDFNRDMIRNPEATFYGRVEGDSMIEAGINDGDIAVIDRINKVNGTETIVLGSQQYTQKDGKGKAKVFANAIKHDFKSKNPTTRWSDIIRLK
jgi:SOS-response transcriptional repressor LexA